MSVKALANIGFVWQSAKASQLVLGSSFDPIPYLFGNLELTETLCNLLQMRETKGMATLSLVKTEEPVTQGISKGERALNR